MPIPIWAGRYIGLPYHCHGRDRTGLDCWGLVRLALGEQAGLALPSYAADYKRGNDANGIGKLVEKELQKWQPVADGGEKLFDIVILRLRGQPMHVGLVLGDQRMLHIERGINSAIERYDSSRWQNLVFGFFRYTQTTDDI